MMHNRKLWSWPVLLCTTVLFFLWNCGEKQQKILPKKKAITESVYTSVTIQPDSLYQAYAAVAGILDNNLVEEGDLVDKGTALLQIINTRPKLNTENARLALQLAEENYEGSSAVLKNIQDQIDAAKLSLQNDSVNYFRQKNLWDQKIGSKVEYDNRKLAYELSHKNLNSLINQYERSSLELRTQMEQASNNYKNAQESNRDFTVSSKINGRVYALFKNPGEIVNTMEPLAALGSKDVFISELLVDEVDIVKLSLGQKAIIALDAYPNEVFEAKVSKIYPKKDERSQTFKVEALFIAPPETLYPGLSGEGNIIIANRQGALTIPKEYLIDGNKVETEDGIVEIVLGLQNLEEVEVLSGIDENTYVLKPEE
ncbi:efflux RND transporter periplasmic adaptor subunit [Muriicola sp. Z0-33]|uniref:efflux RND transporter periplasmic adaptor subunit n=1 Tax=Muriicola sp. Z0-33 TaxID=2816957 RepID=UPI002AA2A4F1|nr:HlyD family efflux transporter periplasmic adaptor subunit [Muriicola sp. Z0-33]